MSIIYQYLEIIIEFNYIDVNNNLKDAYYGALSY